MPQECVHYWYMDAEGKGKCKCKKCGAIRDFHALLARQRNAKFFGLDIPLGRVGSSSISCKD